jgi:hypothetical protein
MPADPVGRPNSMAMVSSLLTLILVLYTRFGFVSNLLLINCVVNDVKNAFLRGRFALSLAFECGQI